MKKNTILPLISVLLAAALSGCSFAGNPSSASLSPTPASSSDPSSSSLSSSVATDPSSAPVAVYKKITAKEAKEMMGQDGAIVLDVRTPEEFQTGHIAGALLIPDTEIADKAPDLLPDKSAVILVYCRSGRRSALASQALVQLGYWNVYDFGGIIDWPYDVVTD